MTMKTLAIFAVAAVFATCANGEQITAEPDALLDYIEATGSQYIDTGVNAETGLKASIDIAIEGGSAVVKTPPMANTAGFAVSVMESGDIAGAWDAEEAARRDGTHGVHEVGRDAALLPSQGSGDGGIGSFPFICVFPSKMIVYMRSYKSSLISERAAN